MFTTASKWFFGLGLVAFVLAVAYGYTTGGDRLGPLTAGWYGAVGDHGGYGVLLAISALAVFLGAVAVATRDADADAIAQVAGLEVAPAEVPPAEGAYWPAVGAVGVALTVVGAVVEPALFIAGLIVVGVTLLEWMVLAWSDRATGDPAANRTLRDRLMRPLEFPIAGAAFAALFVFGLSRLFLTASKMGAVVVAGTAAALVLLVGALVATRPRISGAVVTAVVVLSAVGIVSAGVVSAARGERTFHHHEEEGEGPQNRVLITPGVGIGGLPAPDGETSGTDEGGDDGAGQGTAGESDGEQADEPDETTEVDAEGDSE
jgi:hypothetical protein